VTAAETADLALDAAFLMSAPDAGRQKNESHP